MRQVVLWPAVHQATLARGIPARALPYEQLGFQRRFDPAYVEARRLVETGELGTVYLVRLIAHDHEPPPDAYIPVSGGLFRDSSIHDFDALRWVTGVEVDEGYAAGSVLGFPIFEDFDDVDTGAVILQMTDGTLAVLGQTRHDPGATTSAWRSSARTTRSPSDSERIRRFGRWRPMHRPCPVRPGRRS